MNAPELITAPDEDLMNGNLLSYYEAIEHASLDMLNAARAGDWDTVVKLEGACAVLIAQLKHASDDQNRQDELDARSKLYEARLRAQYTALDKTMANISGQSSYVTQMITNMNKG